MRGQRDETDTGREHQGRPRRRDERAGAAGGHDADDGRGGAEPGEHEPPLHAMSTMMACRCALKKYAMAKDKAPMTCVITGTLSR